MGSREGGCQEWHDGKRGEGGVLMPAPEKGEPMP